MQNVKNSLIFLDGVPTHVRGSNKGILYVWCVYNNVTSRLVFANDNVWNFQFSHDKCKFNCGIIISQVSMHIIQLKQFGSSGF